MLAAARLHRDHLNLSGGCLMSRTAKDLTDQPFGRLIVKSLAYRRKYGKATIIYWHCECRCGNTCIVAGSKLRSGYTQSCGCISRERHYRHGQTLTPEYTIWQHMLQRCYNTKLPRYSDYGGRGITVCDEWRYSFETFYKDMGPRPSPKHSLERENNNLGYGPGNVIWATQSVQTRNTRRNRPFTINGRTQCLQDWVNEYGLALGAVRTRLRLGWSIEEALTTEVQSHLITFGDVTHSLMEWSRKIGINHQTLAARLERWTIERALTEPVHAYTKGAR
jgi:hypothetical protein